MCRPTIFLDRDGTLNEEVHYLFRPEDLRLIPTAAKAVRLWNQAGFRVVVVTNQAGVARGYYREEEVGRLHAYMNQLLARENAHIDQFYYCPHHPEHGIGKYKVKCHCRKPDTGMFEQAEREERVDKHHSYMIGDKWIDIEAGFRFGVNTALVGTGYGKEMLISGKMGSVWNGTEERNAQMGNVWNGTGERNAQKGNGWNGTGERNGQIGNDGKSSGEKTVEEMAKEHLGYFGETLLDVAEWVLEREGIQIKDRENLVKDE